MDSFLVRKRSLFVVFVLLLTLALAVWPSAAQSNPEDVAKALIAAEDSNNVDAAVAYFADDAVVNLAPPLGVQDTPEKIRAWQQELADGHFRIEALNIQADGNTVTWTGNVSWDPLRNVGIASLAANWKLDIENGKVKTFDFSFPPEAETEETAGFLVATLLTAEAAHDVDTAVALFADNAVVTLPDGVYDTPEKILGWQQELAAEHFHPEPIARLVEGNTVTIYGEAGLDRFRKLGVGMVSSTWKIVVDNGKITTFDFALTPGGLATLQAAIAALPTPEATASS